MMPLKERSGLAAACPALVLAGATLAGGPAPPPGALNFADVTSTRIVMTVAEGTSNEKRVDTGDYDRDGDPDVLMGVGQSDFGQRRNKLYRNDGGTFVEVSGTAVIPDFAITDVTRAAWFGDFDGDGWLDIWVANDGNSGPGPSGAHKVFINQHPGDVFTGFVDEAASRFPLADLPRTAAGMIGDFDGDGDLDLYSGNAPPVSQDNLFRNDGTGVFANVTGAMVPIDSDYAVDVATADMNGDGKLDLLISNGFSGEGNLYLNDFGPNSMGVGDFRSTGSVQAVPEFASNENKMAPVDLDGDGDPDLYWANAMTNVDLVYRNDGNDAFGYPILTPLPSDLLPATTQVQTRKVRAGDLNADGRMDLFVPTDGLSGGRPIVLRNVTVKGVIELLDWTPAKAFPTGTMHTGWEAAMFDTGGDGDVDLLLGGTAGDHLFEQVPPDVLAEDALVDGAIPNDGDAIAVIGSAATGERVEFEIEAPAALAIEHVAAIVTSDADVVLEILSVEDVVLASSDRGGMGVEEARQVEGGGASVLRIAVEMGQADARDLDANGMIGFSDLSALLAIWGPCGMPCAPDFDGNGDVGFADLVTLLAAWGPVPDASYALEIVAR